MLFIYLLFVDFLNVYVRMRRGKRGKANEKMKKWKMKK